jgi:serine/threonine protein phosphatase PrpC
MDTFDIASQPGRGAQIVGTRWLRAESQPVRPYLLDVGVATRPCQGQEVNGDTFVVMRWGDSVLAGVIDGLGHGPFAQRAAETARQFVESHYDRPLDEIFRGVARVCRATRGVVMALARVDADQQSALHLTFASIGNVEARTWGAPESLHLAVRRGVLGGAAPAPELTRHAWDLDGVLVLHSDGVSARWRWEDLPGGGAQPAATMAQRLLRAAARAEDDATVVVVKRMVPEGSV